MAEVVLYKCPDDDPLRCQADIRSGQCPHLSLAGMFRDGLTSEEKFRDIKKCPRHGGYDAAAKNERKKVHDYRLKQWEQRIDEFAESDQVKNLRGEIGVIRMMIEEILNMCNGNSQQLMIYSTRVSKLIMDCERLVRSCDRLEDKMGMMMDKTAVLFFGGKVVEIIARFVDDEQLLNKISDGILEALGEMT